MANKVRNNLQESLRDLGPNTNYAGGESVSVAKENAGSPLCTPLPGWRFSTGPSFRGPTPATLNLSVERSTLRTDIVTQESAPELDSAGQPTGRSIPAAVTVALNPAEQAAAARGSLIAQGGTPAQPLNGLQEQYGYGALRCAQDAVNGDNVEYVSFPAGARHVFCYYYAVAPPPTAGTITVRKVIAANSSGVGRFRFDGNLSYADSNGDGVNDFTLTADAQTVGTQTFIRGAGGAQWTFAEQPVTGWAATGPPQCTVTNPDGTPTSGIGVVGQSVSVRLGPLDNVTCTFTNQRATSGITLSKETLGGVGQFRFELVGLVPPEPPAVVVATTTQPDSPTTFLTQANLPPGRYSAREVLPPPTRAGSWALTGVSCNGQPIPTTGSPDPVAEITIPASGNFDCVVVNTFTPEGSIAVTKTSVGGTGTFRYTATPDTADLSYTGTATTTTADLPVAATNDATGTAPLAARLTVDPAIIYTVTEQLPPPSSAGYWQPVSANCGPNARSAFNPGTATITVALTEADPHANCAFTNRFITTPPITPPPSSAPTTSPPPPTPSDPSAASGTTPRLAATGTPDAAPVTGFAVLLIAAGLVIIISGRQRRHR